MRLLTGGDLPALMRLKDAAGWNQTEQDWRNVMRLSPQGCFGLDCDRSLVATATAVCYGGDLAWIGMVLTDPAHRGRGFARRLMEHAIRWIEAQGVAWIKLDATDMGRPLYTHLGFAGECVIERWGRRAGETACPANTPPAAAMVGQAVSPAHLTLDLAAFGASRIDLLNILGSCTSLSDGYAMSRPGSQAAYFGPCVAKSPATASALLSLFLTAEPFYWDILATNPAAAALAREYGFAPLRRLVRMVRPGRKDAAPLAHDDSLVFAIGGFEFG